jgi:hypothetical protein
VAQPLNPQRELSPLLVLIRFGIRIAILTIFAAFGSIGFGDSLAALLAMSSILCTVVAVVRREEMFSRALNHWDEAIIYAVLYFGTIALGAASPV